MRKMVEPEIEVLKFDGKDVIVTSGCPMDCSGDCIWVCSGDCTVVTA